MFSSMIVMNVGTKVVISKHLAWRGENLIFTFVVMLNISKPKVYFSGAQLLELRNRSVPVVLRVEVDQPIQ